MKQIVDCIDLLLAAPFYLGYLLAANQFCKRYLKASIKNELLFVLFSFSGWLCLNILNRQYSISYMLFILISNLFFIGLIYLLFQANGEKKMLASALLSASVTLIGNFCDSFFSCIALFFCYLQKRSPEVFLDQWKIAWISCFGLCVVSFAVYQMSEHLTFVFSRKSKRWYKLLAIPLFAMVAVIDVVNWGAAHGIMVRSSQEMGLFYDQIFSHMEICILTGLSAFAVGCYVYGMTRIDLEQEKNSQYHAQIVVYQMLEEQYQQSKKLRHDMKNHILALSGLYQSKEWEKLGDYLKCMEGKSLEIGGDLTGNKALDALLYQKKKWAEREQVRWDCEVQLPNTCNISTFDLCILLGNLLDNALEACERMSQKRERFVQIQVTTIKNYVLLEIKNSMEQMVPKENPQEHGIGLLNVKDILQKYNGVWKIETEHKIFVVSILIPLNSSAYDIK